MERTNLMKRVSAFLLCASTFAFLQIATPPVVSADPILGADLASFAVLGQTGVTNSGLLPSTIGGNLGAITANSITSTTDPAWVFSSGSLQANTTLAQNAQLQLDDAILAVNAHVASAANTIVDGNLDTFQAGQLNSVIAPGTYAVGFNTTNLAGTLVLDGGGSNSAVWFFEFSSSLITANGSNVVVQNVGDGSNIGIYWTVGSLATLNGSTFVGNVMAGTSITSDGGLTLTCGRLLAATGNVTLIGDTINGGCASIGSGGEGSGGLDQGGGIPGAPVPEPTTFALLGTGIAVFMARMLRKA